VVKKTPTVDAPGRGVSHFFPSLLMASSASMAIPSESIHFSNLEFAITKDVELGPSTSTIANGNPTSDMTGRWLLSKR
jgi:hypothetical protein